MEKRLRNKKKYQRQAATGNERESAGRKETLESSWAVHGG